MKRLIFRLMIGLLTFLTGIVSTGLLTHYPFHSTEKLSVAVPIAAEFKVKVNPPAEWKKIDVHKPFPHNPEILFSFYIPSDMKQVVWRDTVGFSAPPTDFSNKTLRVSYIYIEKRDNEIWWDGKLSCESSAINSTDQLMSRSSEVELGGRRAAQTIWQTDKPKLNHMALCFPDIGDGTILKLGTVSKDELSLDIAEQIFGTIEFR